jgi:hypothetical protein
MAFASYFMVVFLNGIITSSEINAIYEIIENARQQMAGPVFNCTSGFAIQNGVDSDWEIGGSQIKPIATASVGLNQLDKPARRCAEQGEPCSAMGR